MHAATPHADARFVAAQARALRLPAISFPQLASAGEVPARWLRGRHAECAALDRLVASVRAGHSRVLVLRGEPGAGKTALLSYLVENAGGCRVTRVAGVASELELAFAGLHQLCAPFLDRLEELPGPQRHALGAAFGLQDGSTADRFVVGLATVSLLSRAAARQPLVCIVDDAQWLDPSSAQTLAFVARHLAGEPVAVVFAMRDPAAGPHLAGLPELAVGGLAGGDARALLESVVTGPLDERVRDRIVAEARGNPLALLELARGFTHEELAGGFGLPARPAALALTEEDLPRRLDLLPPATRRLLLVAAAEPVQDPVVLWRAADQLGIIADAAVPAAEAGLIEPGGQVRFRHPLARCAVYWAASAAERQSVHRALAAATDPDADPDRRAWHGAHAAAGLDEQVAAELERSADRAGARGGLAAAAAFRQRAAELTPEPARRAGRALAAAHAKHRAGAADTALRLLAMAQAGPLDELGRARADLLRAQLEAGPGRGRNRPARLILAARRLEALDPVLARRTYRDAFYAAFIAGRLAISGGMREAAEAVLAAPAAPGLDGAPDLLDGLATLCVQGYAAGVPALRQVLGEFEGAEMSAEAALGWLPLACHVSYDVWDDERCYTLATRVIELARDVGALTVFPLALVLGVHSRLLAGEHAAAAGMAQEAAEAAQAAANPVGYYGPLLLAAWSGQETEAREQISVVTAEMMTRGEGQWLTVAHWATALLCNGLGRYDQALAAAEQGSQYADELVMATSSMVELIEAAARAGVPQRAAGALARLAEITSAAGTDWALGIQARSRALLTGGPAADRLYREAIERLGRTRIRAELGRAHLLYGEWLRRQQRRMDAREQLRTAWKMLTEMGIEGFAERARRELLATGETVRKRSVETVDELTAQEAQVAQLAGAGHTNAEIGAQLFISARTVEWHLGKVFSKLGIASRKELREALCDLSRVAVAG